MALETIHVELPSGGWWNILAAPTWGDARRWAALLREPAGDDLVDSVLADLTAAWSFDEEATAETVRRRDAEDLAAALDAFHRAVMPRLGVHAANAAAEQLFAGMAAGRIPEEFADVHLMASTGWSWRELQQTPADVAARMAVYLAVRQARLTGGSLELPNPEE